MDQFQLDDLVDRLRQATGHTVRAKLPSSHGRRLDEGSTLILQQCLRRHPALTALHLSPMDTRRVLLGNLREVANVEPSEATNMEKLLLWINTMTDELELERLTYVYEQPEKVMQSCKRQLLDRLGIDQLPDLSQNPTSLPSPWNVSVVLLAGPLFNCQFLTHSKGEVRVANAPAAVVANLQLINSNVYDVDAWTDLLIQLDDFPISTVRSVLQAALYYYPTSGGLTHSYLVREIQELRVHPRLSECSDEQDAKLVMRSTMRILNFFYRHLPISFSVELYKLFFDFIDEFVHPDNATLDTLFRVCLRRDTGNLPTSTDLWTRYLSWRSACFHDGMRKREWMKRMYRRILQLPLLGLDVVKEGFDGFVAVDLRGRLPIDEKIDVEKRLTRAKAEAHEIQGMLTAHIGRGIYLPAPLAVVEAGNSLSMDASPAVSHWAAWSHLIDHVTRPLAAETGPELLHYSRVRFFYAKRAATFPHQLDSWADFLFYAEQHQPALSEKERAGYVLDIVERTLYFSNDVLGAVLLSADFYGAAGRWDLAYSTIREELLSTKTRMVKIIKDGAADDDSLLCVRDHLQNTATLAVNWMRRVGSLKDNQHVALVARFVMHQVEFLSLTMASLRKFLVSRTITEPSSLLRPFNTYCLEWLQMEVIRNKAVAHGLLILRQWKEHLVMIAKSSSGKGWSAVMCGVDDQFLRGCQLVVAANAGYATAVSSLVVELEQCLAAAGAEWSSFHYLSSHCRHSWFQPLSAESVFMADANVRAILPRASPLRYDTEQFCSTLFAKSQTELLKETVLDWLPPSDGQNRYAISVTVDTYPEEIMWGPAAAAVASAEDLQVSFKRRRQEDDGSHLAQQAKHNFPRRAHVVESTSLPTIEDCIAWMNDAAATTGDRVPPLTALEGMIRELPTMNQYNPLYLDKENVSSEWLVECLSHCERFGEQ